MKRTSYDGTKVSVARSQDRIRTLLARFGASGFSVSEDFKTGDGQLTFVYKDMPVILSVSASRYAKVKMENEPWTSRRRCTEEEYEAKLTEEGAKGIWRAAETWIKAQLEGVEFGFITFEDAFLAHFGVPLPGGGMMRLGDRIKPMLNSPAKLQKLLT